MASLIKEERQFCPFPQIDDVPPNSRVFWFLQSELSKGYSAHIYCPNGRRELRKGCFYVTWRDSHWHALRHRQGESFPYLGPVAKTVHEFNQSLESLTPGDRIRFAPYIVPLPSPTSSEELGEEQPLTEEEESRTSTDSVKEDYDLDALIRATPTSIQPPPTYTMATQTTTAGTSGSTTGLTSSNRAPAPPPPTRNTPDHTADLLRAAL
jgi:hypothetical protein